MKTIKKLIEEAKAQNFVSERQINLLKRRLNDDKICFEDYNDLIDFDISEEQNKKGIDFLMKHNFKSNGEQRKNCKLGYREEEILKEFKRFTFDGFYPTGNGYINQFQPIYSVCSEDNSFQYYYNGGEMQIVG